jgi:excisionase family DNA binding protein
MADDKDNKPKLLTIKEAADRAQIHPETAYKLARSGKMPGAVKLGGVWRINCKRLDAAMGQDS